MIEKNKLAIMRCKNIRNQSANDQIRESMDIAIEAIEKTDKYRWHDLRKNPDDLPPRTGDYMCRVGSHKYPERPMTYMPWDLRPYNSNQWKDDMRGYYVLNHFVVAWREFVADVQ